MKKKDRKGNLNPDAIKSLSSAKQHFLTANREDILALNDVIDFVKQLIEGYDEVPAVTSLTSLLTMLQLLLEVIIKRIIDPLRIGEMPADAGEIVFTINSMVDKELTKLGKDDPADPRLQILWSIKEILAGKKRQKKAKKVKRITVE
jgi:hypothetical protein